jgi:DNA-binding response OmpR family regulator
VATVLVVEDDPRLGALLARSLGSAGHTAVWSGSATDALTRVAELAPDVVLIDLHLADMSGADLARDLRAMRSPARLVGLSGELPSKAALAPFDDFMLKPVALNVLLGALQ